MHEILIHMNKIAIALGVIATAYATLGAQEFAPASVAGRSAVVVVSAGTGSFTPVGGYRITFARSDPGFDVSPIGGPIRSSAGAFAYTRISAKTGRLALSDGISGTTVIQTLEFSSSSTAAFSITDSTGTQLGLFVLENAASQDAGMINISVRTHVAAGAQLVPGIVLDSPTRVLIRAAGPALNSFGVTGTLGNPKLTVMIGNRALVSNDDWSSTISNHDAVRDASAKAGAFPFNFGSRDAAVLVDLTAGNYTCLITGDPGTSGEVLLECYRVPP